MKKYLLIVLAVTGIITAKSQVTRNLVYEEATGAWCQYCPRGTWYGDSLMRTYNNVIFISVHGGDIMSIPGYVDSAGLKGYPTANIDRIKKALGTNVWFEGYGVRNSEKTYVKVTVAPAFNASTRNLSIKVSGNFSKAYTGDYRFAAIVIEDGVVGSTTDYNQTNAFAGSANYVGGYEKMPSSIPYYMIAYDDVARQLLGGYSGVYGSLPGTIAKNSKYDHTFNWTVPAEYRSNYIRVVGLVIDGATNEIINAGVSDYIDGSTNASPFFVNEPNKQGYVGIGYRQTVTAHDPDDHILTVTAQNLPSWLKMKNIGNNRYTLEGTPTIQGDVSFTMKVVDGNSNSQSMNVTLHIDPAFPHTWEMVSNSPVSPARARQSDFAIGPDNTIYAVYADYATNGIYVKKYQNGSWTMVGSPLSGDNYDVSIAVDKKGVPHIAYNHFIIVDNVISYVKLVMKKFDGSKWVQVADVIQEGPNNWPEITFDSKNNPYVAYTSGNSNTAIYCFLAAIDAGYWLNLGFLVSNNGLYPHCVFDSKDVPYVIWANYYDSMEVNVSYYDESNMEWKLTSTNFIGRTSSYLDLAIDKNDNMYCAFAEEPGNTLSVFKKNGTKWTKIGNNLLSGEVYGRVEIETDQQGNVYVMSLENEWGNYVTVLKYNGSKWSNVGPPRFSQGGVYYTELLIDNNNIPLAAFTDEGYSRRYVIMSYGTYTDIENNVLVSNGIDLYPNPANDNLYIALDGFIKSYSIYDITGRRVLNRELNLRIDHESLTVDVSTLEPGSYILKVNKEKEVQTQSLQIAR